MENTNFALEKKNILLKIDKSNKKSFDSLIYDIIELLNNSTHYVTTSSCSGRAVILGCDTKNRFTSKSNVRTIYSTHDKLISNELLPFINNCSEIGGLVFKYEGFILHVSCSSINSATELLKIGLEAGYRNSGIVMGKRGRLIVAIRSNLTTETPLSDENTLLVTEEYIQFLLKKTNEKVDENIKRINKFLSLLKILLEN